MCLSKKSSVFLSHTILQLNHNHQSTTPNHQQHTHKEAGVVFINERDLLDKNQ